MQVVHRIMMNIRDPKRCRGKGADEILGKIERTTDGMESPMII